MATWKKMIVEDSADHIAETSKFADNLNAAGAGSRTFAATPEVLFQTSATVTESLARGAADTFLRMSADGLSMQWIDSDDLTIAGASGSGSVDLDNQTLTITSADATEITAVAANQTITIGLPDDVTIDGDLTVSGNKITFGNAEYIDNDTNAKIKITADTTELTGNLQVTGNNIKSSTGETAITLSENDVIVDGNLTVSGDQTIVNTEIIQLADNVIVLNSNHTGAPSQDGGIIVKRGSADDAGIFWDESDAAEIGGRWTVATSNVSELDTIAGFVSTVQSSTSAPTSSNDGTGFGSFWIDSDAGPGSSGQVYVRMS